MGVKSILGDSPYRMDYARDIAKDCQQDIDPEVLAQNLRRGLTSARGSRSRLWAGLQAGSRLRNTGDAHDRSFAGQRVVSAVARCPIRASVL